MFVDAMKGKQKKMINANDIFTLKHKLIHENMEGIEVFNRKKSDSISLGMNA